MCVNEADIEYTLHVFDTILADLKAEWKIK